MVLCPVCRKPALLVWVCKTPNNTTPNKLTRRTIVFGGFSGFKSFFRGLRAFFGLGFRVWGLGFMAVGCTGRYEFRLWKLEDDDLQTPGRV